MKEKITNYSNTTIHILTYPFIYAGAYPTYELIFMLDGYASLQIDDMPYTLKEKDIILIDPCTPCTFHGNRGFSAVQISIQPSFVQKNIPIHAGSFHCNTISDKYHSYHILRQVIAQLAIQVNNSGHASILYRKSLELMLLYCLMNNHFEFRNIHSSLAEQASDQERVQATLVFIQQHYREHISLKLLSQQLHLSVSYLSKIFKQSFGQSFYQYLNSYRIDCSLSDLLYTNTTVTDLAFQYGFPNTNSYIDYFKKKYQCTPYAYRKMNSKEPLPELSKADTSLSGKIRDLLSPYTKNDMANPPLYHPDLERKCFADTKKTLGNVVPIWKSGMNISHAQGLIQHNISNELLIVTSQLSITYARFFFSLNQAFLAPSSDNNYYNFYHFTYSVNMLLERGLKPYLDLRQDVLMPETVIDTDKYLDLVRQLLIYSINTYGRHELSQWIWEIGIGNNFVSLKLEDPAHFTDRFIRTYHLIKEHLPDAKVGGIGLFSAFPPHLYYKILVRILKAGVYPDFISTEIFPYDQISEGRDVCVSYSPDPSYALHYIKELKQEIQDAAKDTVYQPLLFISSMGICIPDRSYLSDTCYQSTFLVKNTLDLIHEVDMICYFQMSDDNFSYWENQLLLNGRNGLLAHFDLPKPGFLALELMCQMSGELLEKGDNYMILKENSDKYTILMCNHPIIKPEYCLNLRKPLAAKDAYMVFEDFEDIHMSIILEHLNDGNYQITSSHINREHGSIFDEWARSNYTTWTDDKYLSYLQHILCPQKLFTQKTCVNGKLQFDLLLKPLEVILIEITYII